MPRSKGSGMKDRQTLYMHAPGDLASRIDITAKSEQRSTSGMLRVLVQEALAARKSGPKSDQT